MNEGTKTNTNASEDVPVNELVDNHEAAERERRAALIRQCLPEDECKLLEFYRSIEDECDRSNVLDELSYLCMGKDYEKHIVSRNELSLLQGWREMTPHQRQAVANLIHHLGHGERWEGASPDGYDHTTIHDLEARDAEAKAGKVGV